MKYLWKILTTPSCWIRLYPTNKLLDAKIVELLDNNARLFCHPRSEKIVLSYLQLWGANYPYAYGALYDSEYGMPSRATVFRLAEKHFEETLYNAQYKQRLPN